MVRTAVLAALLLAGLAGCGGGDDGGDGLVGDEKASIEIHPRAGPPGTRIEWKLSGCEEQSEKSVSLMDRRAKGAGPAAGAVATAIPRDPAKPSGVIVVPTDVTKGPLIVGAICASKEGQREPPFEMEVVEAQFESTGAR